MAQAQDADGDGQGAEVYGGLDCDDQAPETFAGAPEQCDGLDNDCDQVVDEDIEGLETFFPDADSDSYGDESGEVQACEAPEGFVAQAGDCDDTTASVRPGESELCGNGVDDNCTGDSGACWHVESTVDGLDLVRSMESGFSIAFWPGEESLILHNETAVKEVGVLEPSELLSSGSETMKTAPDRGLFADQSVLAFVDEVSCLSPDLQHDPTRDCPIQRELEIYKSVVVGKIACFGGTELHCFDAPETDGLLVENVDVLVGRGAFEGLSQHLAAYVAPSVRVYSQADILSENAPTATLTLPSTPTSLCLLNQAVVWADADGTHLTSAAGQSDLLTQTTGTLSCMEAGSEYVLIIPPSNDQVEVVNLSGFGDPAWGAPLVVTLPESDPLLVNKATLAQESGQAYLFIAHGTELRRMELGLGL